MTGFSSPADQTGLLRFLPGAGCGEWFSRVEPIALASIAGSVCELEIGSRVWVAAEGEGQDVVDLGGHRIQVGEGLVYGATA